MFLHNNIKNLYIRNTSLIIHRCLYYKIATFEDIFKSKERTENEIYRHIMYKPTMIYGQRCGKTLCRDGLSNRTLSKVYKPMYGSSQQMNTFMQTRNFSSYIETITELPIVLKMMKIICWCHDISGLSWPVIAILLPIILKLCISLPAMIEQSRTSAKLIHINYEMRDTVVTFRKEVNYNAILHGWNNSTSNKMLKFMVSGERRRLILRDNCHPGKIILLSYIQIPIIIGATVALRNLISMRPFADELAKNIYIEIFESHIGWIDCLVMPDPTYILPILFMITTIFNTEFAIAQRKILYNLEPRKLDCFIRGCTLLLSPISLWMPSAILLYWVTNSTCTVAQNIAFLSPAVRMGFKIPLLPTEADEPYKQLLEEMSNKYDYVKRIFVR